MGSMLVLPSFCSQKLLKLKGKIWSEDNSIDPLSANPLVRRMRTANLSALEAHPDSAVPALFPGPLLILMGIAFLVVFPFFFLGNPSGHDFEFHMYSWMEVVSQWKQGVFYPHWAALSHWGYGEARFLFYPPFSWNLGAALGTILPWVAVPGVYIWMAVTAAGCSMFLFARHWLSRWDAIVAAALYAANPYHLVVIYWRSALAELMASCLLPVLLLCLLGVARRRPHATIALSVLIAAAWLINGPSAVMVNYSVALLALVLALARKDTHVLWMSGAAVILGALLASFYLVPAACEQHWVNLGEVFAPGVRPQDNFLFTLMPDVDHNRFNWLISVVALAEIVALGGALALTAYLRRAQRSLCWLLGVWAAMATLLTLSFTNLLWEHLPKLRFVQLPWRWLLCLNVAFAFLVTTGFRRNWQRMAIYATMLLVIGLLWWRIQNPWWDEKADIDEMHDAIQDGTGYEGTDEYVPTGVDPYDIDKNAPQVTLMNAEDDSQPTQAPGQITINRWLARSREFRVHSSAQTVARVRLFNYPAWKVTVDGLPVEAQTVPKTGELLVPLEAGTHRVSLVFSRTRDRTLGAILSLLAVILLVILRSVQRSALGNDEPVERAA